MTYLSRQNKAKKFIFALFFLGLLSLGITNFVYAQAQDQDSNDFASLPPATIPKAICGATDDLIVCAGKWAATILRYLIFAAVAFAVIFIAFAGVEYIILGKGDNAKKRIIAAVVGLVIAFIAYVGVRMLVNTLIK